jgi:hypothetical protein
MNHIQSSMQCLYDFSKGRGCLGNDREAIRSPLISQTRMENGVRLNIERDFITKNLLSLWKDKSTKWQMHEEICG